MSNPNTVNRAVVRVAATALVVAMLAGCGQKGDLYRPDRSTITVQPAR